MLLTGLLALTSLREQKRKSICEHWLMYLMASIMQHSNSTVKHSIKAVKHKHM